MLFMYLRNLSTRKSLCYSNQCRPKAAMDECDSSINQTANEHLVGIGYCLKGGENLMALRMSPPTPLNRLVDDRLCQPRNGAFSRCENYAVLLNKGDRFIKGHASLSLRLMLHSSETVPHDTPF